MVATKTLEANQNTYSKSIESAAKLSKLSVIRAVAEATNMAIVTKDYWQNKISGLLDEINERCERILATCNKVR